MVWACSWDVSMERLSEYTARKCGLFLLSARTVVSTWASSQKGHDWLPSLPEKRVMRSLVCAHRPQQSCQTLDYHFTVNHHM